MAKRIGFISDLHYSYWHYVLGDKGTDTIFKTLNLFVKSNTELLVIAGDMCFSFVNMKIDIFKWLSTHFKYTIMVMGNHDYWQNENENSISMFRKLDNFKRQCSAYSNLIVLQNETFIYDDIKFLGTTLWSNFSALQELSAKKMNEIYKDDLRVNLNDFKYVFNDRNERITINDMRKEFDNSIRFLQEETKNDNNVNIIITHFAPSKKSIASKYLENSNNIINSYFCNDLDKLIKAIPIKYWIHGHTHTAFNYNIGSCQVKCNPLGYPYENNKIKIENSILEIE